MVAIYRETEKASQQNMKKIMKDFTFYELRYIRPVDWNGYSVLCTTDVNLSKKYRI